MFGPSSDDGIVIALLRPLLTSARPRWVTSDGPHFEQALLTDTLADLPK